MKTSTERVELDGADARNILRHGLDQRFGSPLREEQSERAAEPGEQQTFRE